MKQSLGKLLLLIALISYSYLYGFSNMKQMNIGIMGNGFIFVDKNENSSAFRQWFNIKFGYNFTPRISTEISGGYGWNVIKDNSYDSISSYFNEDENSPYKTTIAPIDFKFRYNLTDSKKLTPYISIGAGIQPWGLKNSGTNHVMYGTAYTASLETGLELKLNQLLSCQLGANYSHFVGKNSPLIATDSEAMSRVEFKLGLNFHFGGSNDRDNDGIPNHIDRSPYEPEDMDNFQDEDGMPEPDNDNDGILDIDDKAPNEAEDFDGFQDDDGIPDIDNDGDGILDIHDLAPNEAEDFDQYQDTDGKPDMDNDGDGILDVDDLDPYKPETINGYNDHDGLPDKKPEIILEKKRPIILEDIAFVPNQALLDDKAKLVLVKVAQTLHDYPRISLEISGHTDNRGSYKKNMDLSIARAKAVKQYLVDLGIARGRLKAIGLGSQYPITSNDTKAGRDKNRRIEFFRVK